MGTWKRGKPPPPQARLDRAPVPYSNVRECLKLDQDDKECFSHYKQVKKLSRQLDAAEELVQSERSVLLATVSTHGVKSVPRVQYPVYLQSATRKPLRSMKR